MDSKEPMNRFLTGISSRFDVPNKCKRVLQAIIFELDDNGKCVEAFKVKAYDENCATITQNAYYEK
jgi:calcineurin-like phosphoesterase